MPQTLLNNCPQTQGSHCYRKSFFRTPRRTQENAINAITVLWQQKDTSQNQPKEETHRERCGGVSAFMSLRSVTFPAYRYISLIRETYLSFRYSKLVLEFHYVRMIVESLFTWLSSIFIFSPLPGGWGFGLISHGSKNLNPQITWSVFLAKLASILKSSRSPQWVTLLA